MNAVVEPSEIEVTDQHASSVAVIQPTTLLDVISRAAANPNTDIEKMERLMAMHERMVARDAEQAFNVAMSVAQSEIGRIATNKKNSQTHSDYATYAALDRVVRPVYTQHGFALSFDTGDAETGTVRVLCYVTHSGGFQRTYKVTMPADGKGAKGGDVMTKTHAAGSAMTYGKRYLLQLIFNTAIGEDPDDDDGNAATPRMTDRHALEIEARANEISDDMLRKVLASFKAQRLADLPDAEFEPIMNRLAAHLHKPRPPYPEASFAKNCEAWKVLVTSGKKTPQDLIALFSSKYTLSDQQRADILALGVHAEPENLDAAA